ncbi:hypothetical protein [Stenotrophomonas sp. 24(2023)]|uniref:hypothetical protein n=1 Tax=Stenotrophomonas sp. 24(2023) TaxID=3068324 RepID=UPI0027E21455|nr:hypothetical protein [Stenotrophomonas sp. 24(2023)]WMJ68502.1 hypothetical protein Q9R17_15040 [Stenotrophomonas sp. 24(2023)]
MRRTLLMGALIAAALPAGAEPAVHPLQIRLTVVEGCPAGDRPCAVPRQRSDAPGLPAQLRELAPSAALAGDDAVRVPLTTIY